MIKLNFHPRNDFVLIRKTYDEITKGGIAVPQKSAEGAKFYVVATGPDVKGLKIGQRVVMCVSNPNEHFAFPIPREQELYAVKQEVLGVAIDEVEVPDPPVEESQLARAVRDTFAQYEGQIDEPEPVSDR